MYYQSHANVIKWHKCQYRYNMTQGNACITSQVHVQGASSKSYSPQYSIPHSSGQPYGGQNGGQRNEQKVTNQGAYHQPSNLIHGQFQSHTPTHVHGQSNQAPYHVPNNTYHHMYHQAPMHIGQVPHDSMPFGTNGFEYVDQFVPGGYHYGSYPYYPPVYPPWCYMNHQYPDYNCYHGYQPCQSGHHRYVQGHNHISYPHNHYHQPVRQCHEDPHGNPKQTIQHPCYQQKTNVETNSNLGTTYSNLPNEQSAEHQHILEPADKQYTGYVHQRQNTQQQPSNIDQHHLVSTQNNNRGSYNTALIAHTFDSNKVQTTFNDTVNEENVSSSQKHCQSVAVRSTIQTSNDDNKHTNQSCYVNGECGYQVDDQVTQINDQNCQNGNHVCQNSNKERAPTSSNQIDMRGEDEVKDYIVSPVNMVKEHCQDSEKITGHLSQSTLTPIMPIEGYRHNGKTDNGHPESMGQCGNQIGCRFWDLALREHAAVNKSGIYDESLGSFFRNVDSRYDDPADIPLGSGKGKIKSLKARAVLVDMEEGVVSEAMKGPLKEVFDFQQLITDVSGSGNNWATGHKMYGVQYHEKLSDIIRRTAEFCDCLQCFFVMHSMGGGTGSGVGTYTLNLLADEYPDVYRFVTAVYPSADDDVITSPYNSVLAMRELTDKADCVLPIENQSLVDIVNKIGQAVPSAKMGKRVFAASGVKSGSALTAGEGGLSKPSDERPFDSMNNIVANLLLNLTSSARFEGSLNVDLNEITMNLVPFPRLHYLVASQTPLYALADVNLPPRRLDQMFSDAFSRDHQLIKADPKHSLYLACALMVRGNVEISDVRRNIERLKPNLKFIHWNQEGWKTGLCSVPPVGQPYSLLTLANNTCVHNSFSDLRDRFNRLYKRKAHVHHYTHVDGMEITDFSESLESLNSLVQEYVTLEQHMNKPAQSEPRLQVLS